MGVKEGKMEGKKGWRQNERKKKGRKGVKMKRTKGAEQVLLPTESFPYPIIDSFQTLSLTLTQLSFMTPHNNSDLLKNL